MDDTHAEAPTEQAPLGTMIPLATVRASLADLEGLEREIAARTAHLRATLSPEQFRLVWAVLGAEQRRAIVEQQLTRQHVAAVLMQCLPEHASSIGAVGERP